MANRDLVNEEVLQELINKLEELVNNYCYNLEYFTEDEVNDFFNASQQEITYYNGLINDKITSKNFLWSSKQIADEIAKSVIQSNEYADSMLKNISSIKLEYVEELPSVGDTSVIYILKNLSGNDTLNLYSETHGWTKIGEFNIELSNYYNKTEIDEKLDLKANANEVMANDKITQNLDVVSADTILSTSGLKAAMDNKANDNEVIKKDDIKTTLDKNLTNTDVCSGKAIYDTIKSCASYSTDEQLTGGTWIDGKPIYRKVLLCTKDTSVSTGYWAFIQGWSVTIPNIKDYVSIKPKVNTYGGRIDFAMQSDKSFRFSCLVASINIKVGTPLIIEYTKTTDA